jgi:hypothetical protein
LKLLAVKKISVVLKDKAYDAHGDGEKQGRPELAHVCVEYDLENRHSCKNVPEGHY